MPPGAGRAVARHAGPHPVWPSPGRTGHRVDRGTLATGQGAHRAVVRHAARPVGEADALGGNRHAGSRQSFPGDYLLAVLGGALLGGARAEQQCASKFGARPPAGADSQCARGAHSGFRPHGELESPALGRATRGRLRGASGCARRNRAAARWQPLASFPRSLPAAAGLPGRAATHTSFRPTASRPCGSQTKTPNPNQNPLQSASQSPLEEILEEDISKLLKTGHFYFALTRSCGQTSPWVSLARRLPFAACRYPLTIN